MLLHMHAQVALRRSKLDSEPLDGLLKIDYFLSYWNRKRGQRVVNWNDDHCT
jgi:hypothetical protein